MAVTREIAQHEMAKAERVAINPIVARCADTAMKAVTRWYAEGLHRDGYSLEEYVRDKVRALHSKI